MTTRALALLALLPLTACGKPALVELEPASFRFSARGQTAKLHATPRASDGKPAPQHACRWSSSDDKVATVVGPHNDAVITAVAAGSASIRCTIGDVSAEAPAVVRVVSRVTVRPERAELAVKDEPVPLALEVAAYDDAGGAVPGRAAHTSCKDEGVCRGDARGQLWAVGPGESVAIVEVEGARAEIPVRVVDARTAAGRPQAVRGNPMEEIEREVRKRDKAEGR